MKSKLLFALLAGMLSANTAFADDDDYYRYLNRADCPRTFNVDTAFGAGSTSLTTCIAKQEDIRVVLNMSSEVPGPNGLNQVLNNANNMIGNYLNVWGIDITTGNDLKMNVVAHFKGARSLLTDAKFMAACEAATNAGKPWGVNCAAGNPSDGLVTSLIGKGVHIYMCQTTMTANGWKTVDLIPGVEMVPAGVIALADFAATGWSVITP